MHDAWYVHEMYSFYKLSICLCDVTTTSTVHRPARVCARLVQFAKIGVLQQYILLHNLQFERCLSIGLADILYLYCPLQNCSGTGVSPVGDDVLLLKATSEAAVHTVKDCLALIKLQQVHYIQYHVCVA